MLLRTGQSVSLVLVKMCLLLVFRFLLYIYIYIIFFFGRWGGGGGWGGLNHVIKILTFMVVFGVSVARTWYWILV